MTDIPGRPNVDECERKALAIARIRRELAFWGIDVSSLSDDELESRALAFGQALAASGLSVAQASDALRRFAKA